MSSPKKDTAPTLADMKDEQRQEVLKLARRGLCRAGLQWQLSNDLAATAHDCDVGLVDLATRLGWTVGDLKNCLIGDRPMTVDEYIDLCWAMSGGAYLMAETVLTRKGDK